MKEKLESEKTNLRLIVTAAICTALIAATLVLKLEDKKIKLILAEKISPEIKYVGKIKLHDLNKPQYKQIALLSKCEMLRQKPEFLWSWGTLPELIKSNSIDTTKNRYFYVFTKNKQIK